MANRILNANNLKSPKDVATKIRPIRFTEREDRILLTYAEIVASSTGQKVSVSWVIKRMMDLGKDEFENQYVSGDLPKAV